MYCSVVYKQLCFHKPSEILVDLLHTIKRSDHADIAVRSYHYDGTSEGIDAVGLITVATGTFEHILIICQHPIDQTRQKVFLSPL